MSQFHYPSKIRYEYEEAPNLRLEYAHGVWGGINPQGEIEINFYLESDKMPPFSERQVEPDGNFSQETAPYDEDTRVVMRRLHSRVLLNYHTARAFLEWLQEKVESLEMEEDGMSTFSGDSPKGSFEQ